MTQAPLRSQAVIHVQPGGPTISPHIYGHFAEHLGRCVYDGFWVGPDSAIPNVRGIRADVVQALRKIQVPVLRWPGGCFADEYHWQDGVGSPERRRPMVNTHWGGVSEDNRFGTHEFMDLCQQLACAPYICGNVGSGSVQEMQQWVEYLTAAEGLMADARRANGRAGPWPVPFWGVGNESWGCGGNMRPEYYADQYRRYATYCRNFAPNRLYKIACGANAADYNWTEVLMRDAGRHFDGLSLHYYTVPGTWAAKGSATRFDEADWFVTLQKALFMDELIARHAAIMDRYDPERRVGLMVDEWGAWYEVEPGTPPGFLYQQSTLRDALVAGVTLNIFNAHADRVAMANIAQTVNVLQAPILTDGPSLILTPTYHVFDLYRVHQGAALLTVDLECGAYHHAGSAIPALSVSASRDSRGQVNVTICNLDPEHTLPLACELRGAEFSRAAGRLLTAPRINDHNTAQQPALVQPVAFDGAKLSGSTLRLELPPKSVTAVTLQ